MNRNITLSLGNLPASRPIVTIARQCELVLNFPSYSAPQELFVPVSIQGNCIRVEYQVQGKSWYELARDGDEFKLSVDTSCSSVGLLIHGDYIEFFNVGPGSGCVVNGWIYEASTLYRTPRFSWCQGDPERSKLRLAYNRDDRTEG